MRGLDAYAAAAVGRLDNDGILQFGFQTGDDRILIGIPFLVVEPEIIHHGNVAFLENHLHRNLIHAVG